MRGWLRAGVALAGLVGAAVVALPAPAGAAGITVKVSPDQGLKPGQTVTVSGHGLPKSPKGNPRTWFVTECTAAVRGHVNPTTDTPHCDISKAQALKVSGNGSFSSRYHLATGIIGDGYCGTNGYTACVIGVGDVQGQGTVVHITFKQSPSSSTTTSASASTSTAG